MSKYYFTFGVGIDNQYRNCYHVEEAKTEEQAREAMFNKFGKYWAFSYTEDEWIINSKENERTREMCQFFNYKGNEPISQAELFNLKEI